MRIPILNGIYTDEKPDFRQSYPVNLVPIVLDTGINNGYLKPHDGITEVNTGTGIDRGGIESLGVHYRVMGTKLLSIASNGVPTTIGDVGGTSDRVSFDYSFDLLAIASGGQLYYYNTTNNTLFGIPAKTVQLQTDPNIGTVLDVVFLNGVFVITDGTVVRSSSIADPTVFNPLAYESAEFDPDPVLSLIKLRSEIYVLNRRSIEVFDGVITGNDIYLPFLPIDGAQMLKGCVGTHACCEYGEAIAFMGGGHNEPISIFIGLNAQTTKIATREVEKIINDFTEDQLVSTVIEKREYRDHEFLYVHFPTQTLVYDIKASQRLGSPVWFQLTDSVQGFSKYRARNMVYFEGKWWVGDPDGTSISYFDEDTMEQRGNKVRWEVNTVVLYNNSNGAIMNELELVALTGRTEFGKEPLICTSYSVDGVTYSQKRYIKSGRIGQRDKRLVWFRNGFMRNWRVQKIEGDSDSKIAITRLEAVMEALAV